MSMVEGVDKTRAAISWPQGAGVPLPPAFVGRSREIAMQSGAHGDRMEIGMEMAMQSEAHMSVGGHRPGAQGPGEHTIMSRGAHEPTRDERRTRWYLYSLYLFL